MITDIHKRAIYMWVMAKNQDADLNPSNFIIEQVTGQVIILEDEPQNTIQLCQGINNVLSLRNLTEDEEKEIQLYGVKLMLELKESTISFFTKALWLTWLNKLAYILGAISIIVSGFSWWIVGLGIGTWWAFGAAKLCSQKQKTNPGPKWEMPAHVFIHVLTLLGLVIFSIYNIIK